LVVVILFSTLYQAIQASLRTEICSHVLVTSVETADMTNVHAKGECFALLTYIFFLVLLLLVKF